nr:hypothetical protein [Vibrio anguillarum]
MVTVLCGKLIVALVAP